MRLLLDSDAFCKLALARLLNETLDMFGVRTKQCGRLPALPHMLRRGSLRRSYGDTNADNLVPIASSIPGAPSAGAKWLDVLARVEEIDPGEALLIALAAERSAYLISGDKRALGALKGLAELPEMLRGRIVTVEAVLLALCGRLGVDEVRSRIAPVIPHDKTISVVFSPDNKDPRAALLSYHQDMVNNHGPLVFWDPLAGGAA
jgi:hypothetical protein